MVNVELVIGFSLALVFLIIYEGLNKVSLNGTFITLDSMYYFYYYLLSLNNLINASIAFLLARLSAFVLDVCPLSFLTLVNAIVAKRVFKISERLAAFNIRQIWGFILKISSLLSNTFSLVKLNLLKLTRGDNRLSAAWITRILNPIKYIVSAEANSLC